MSSGDKISGLFGRFSFSPPKQVSFSGLGDRDCKYSEESLPQKLEYLGLTWDTGQWRSILSSYRKSKQNKDKCEKDTTHRNLLSKRSTKVVRPIEYRKSDNSKRMISLQKSPTLKKISNP